MQRKFMGVPSTFGRHCTSLVKMQKRKVKLIHGTIKGLLSKQSGSHQ